MAMGLELKKQISDNKRYYTIENLLEVDWNRNFEFVNPIKKDRIKTLADATEVSRTLMNTLDKCTKSLSICVMSAENILAGIILYVVKCRATLQNNLAIITAICCKYSDGDILEMLEELDETRILSQSMRKNPTLFKDANAMLRQLMVRIYTKEYVRLFVNGSYDVKYSNDENSDYLYERLPLTVQSWLNHKI